LEPSASCAPTIDGIVAISIMLPKANLLIIW
jgi:hypothetical protein